MCKEGGPRCENADALTLARRKIQRSQQYRQARDSQKKSILQEQLDDWKNENKQFVQEHARKRRVFNTRAKLKSAERIASFNKTAEGKQLLSRPTENSYDVNNLIAENKQLQERFDGDVYDSLRKYSFIGFQYLNSYLRNDTKHKDYPDADLMEIVHKEIADMDTVFAEHERSGEEQGNATKDTLSSDPHLVYRETYVPAGWTAKEYAEKYYGLGEVIADPAYMSTSHSQSYMVEKANYEKKRRRGQDSIVLKVLTGSGVSMQTRLPENGTIQSREMERLLPRNHRLVVVGHSRQTFVDAGLTEENYAHPHHRGAKSKKLTVVHLVDESIFSELVRQEQSKTCPTTQRSVE